MDFIILKSDGSLQKQSLTRYIQQGSHGVDEIFIGWANATSAQILQAVFTLPNKLTNTELGTFVSDYEYEPGETINGWVITLTENQTRYNGLLMVSARIILNGIVQVAYPFALCINETGVMPETDSGVTLEQLDSYLLNLQTLVTGAVQANTDSQLSNTSENPVQNRVVKAAIDDAIAGVYKIQGSATVQTLEDLLKAESLNGYVYNVTDSGALTNYDESTLSVVEGDNVCFVWNEGDWFWDNMAGFIDPTNLVTLNTDQTISGKKTFANGIKVPANSANSYYEIICSNGYYLEIKFGGTTNFNVQYDGIINTKNITPLGNNTYNLGTSTNAWKDLYLSGVAHFTNSTTTWSLETNSVNQGLEFDVNGNNMYVMQATTFRASSNNARDLGTSSVAWKDAYFTGRIYIYDAATPTPHEWGIGTRDNYYFGIFASGNTVFYFNPAGTVFARKIEPVNSNTYDLGGSSAQWKDLYLGGTIYLGANTTLQDAGSYLVIAYSGNNVFYVNNSYIQSNRTFIPTTSNTRDLGTNNSLWKDLYLAGNMSDGSASRSIAGLSGKTGAPTVSSNTAELPYDTLSELTLSANTTINLQTAPTGCYPEYKAIITASASITLTFNGVSNFLTNDEDNVVITNGTNTTVALASGTTVEISIVNGKGVAINFGA